MAYPVDPTNPNSPTNTQGATQGAEELRALKAYIAALAVPAAASAGPRQTIVDAVKDASGYNNALSAGAGLRVSLTAVAIALQMTFANGFVNGRAVNLEEQVAANNADILGVDLPLNNTSYLYRNYGVGYGSTLIPPQYGYAFDRTKGALLNFEGANGAVVTTDDFGNTWTLTGATISTTQFKFGVSSLRCAGAQYARSANITTLGDGSWEISCWFRVDAITGTNQTIFNATGITTNTGVYLAVQPSGKLGIWLSSDGLTFNLANAANGIAVIAALTWYKVRVVFDALAGTYRIYLSNNGVAETQDYTLASTARICAIVTTTIGAGSDNLTSFTGYIDAFRFLSAATNTTTEVPSAVAPIITDYSVNWFDIPSMKMWEVTGVSVVAATNPVLTVRSRLFLGEADTSGAAVTAVRNYALKGQVLLSQAILTVSTIYSLAHNIGTRLCNVTSWLECKTSERNWSVGDRINITDSMYNGVPAHTGMTVGLSRNNLLMGTLPEIARIHDRSNPIVTQAAGVSNWSYGAFIQRNF